MKSNQDNAVLKVSEHFYSIQGEGPTVGTPAVFLRLGGCVLNCRWCDTEAVWKKHEKITVPALVDLFEAQGYTAALKQGAHLVITGGDPLMQMESLVPFFYALDKAVGTYFKVEVETEGVLVPERDFSLRVDQWNVSPKLSNSGMPYNRRICIPALMFHTGQIYIRHSFFKIPVFTSEDVQEFIQLSETLKAENSIIIPRNKVWLMPLASTRQAYINSAPRIAELAKQYGFNFGQRLHLMLWDKATGV